jgi:hypothetical protein
MIPQKKFFHIFIFSCFALNTPAQGAIEHESEARFLGIFDDFDLFSGDDDLSDMLNATDVSLALTRIAPQDILDVLKLGAGTHMELLQQNFFLRTNPLNVRNILDMPVFEPATIYPPSRWTLGGHLFWNKTSKSKFTDDKTGLQAYLRILQPNFLDVIENELNDLFGLLDLEVDIEALLKLFRNMTVEDRRTGLMFHGECFWKQLTVRFLLPLYYHERNLNFQTEAEKDAVIAAFGLDPDLGNTDFQDAHFVSDQIGFGDARLEVDTIIMNAEKYRIRLGGMATIPMAFAFKKGIKGTYFKKETAVQNLRFAELNLDTIINGEIDLDNLFDLTSTPSGAQEALDTLLDFLVGSIDHMNATLLDTSLGNHFFGIGPMFRTETRMDVFFKNSAWAEKVWWLGRGSIEYFFPRTIKRFFDQAIDYNNFAGRDFCDPAQADNNLEFIEQQLTDRFYPRYLETRVQPGLLFRWTGRFVFQKNNHWSFFIGSDTWIQLKESFSANSINAPADIIGFLRVEAAKSPQPYQGKIQGGFIYEWERPKRDWLISLNGDYTLFDSGVGHDYTISFNVETHF